MLSYKIKTFLILFIVLFIGNAFSGEYTDEEICQSIYIIEGGEKTNFPYGIKSVSCNGKEECKKICLNTVRNNKKRFSDYGYKEYKTFIKFLASRYCPKGEYLCENWLPNLKFYLKKGEISYFQNRLEVLAEKFDLVEEFEENGII